MEFLTIWSRKVEFDAREASERRVKVIRGWNDEASKEVTEGGRGTGCEGHRNNARREIIPKRQRTVALCFEQILDRPWSSTSNSCTRIGRCFTNTRCSQVELGHQRDEPGIGQCQAGMRKERKSGKTLFGILWERLNWEWQSTQQDGNKKKLHSHCWNIERGAAKEPPEWSYYYSIFAARYQIWKCSTYHRIHCILPLTTWMLKSTGSQSR